MCYYEKKQADFAMFNKCCCSGLQITPWQLVLYTIYIGELIRDFIQIPF